MPASTASRHSNTQQSKNRGGRESRPPRLLRFNEESIYTIANGLIERMDLGEGEANLQQTPFLGVLPALGSGQTSALPRDEAFADRRQICTGNVWSAA